MNTSDILKYGHLTVMGNLEPLSQSTWLQPGVCGIWSVRDIIAHLASFEHVLVAILSELLGKDPGPYLKEFMAGADGPFNDDQVNRRQGLSANDALEEYVATFEKAAGLAAQIPVETMRKNGVLPWYGPEYDLEDFIVYTFYGHKREHMAQVAYFRDHVVGKG
jgi:hypothetical protein